MMMRNLVSPVKVSVPTFSSGHHSDRRRGFTVTAAATATVGANSVRVKQSRSTLYQVLRIKHTASQAEIRAAYRNLAKVYHPDVTSSSSDHNGQDFIEIHNAYATLSDPVARANYDLSIAALSAHFHHLRTASATDDLSVLRTRRRWETDQCW